VDDVAVLAGRAVGHLLVGVVRVVDAGDVHERALAIDRDAAGHAGQLQRLDDLARPDVDDPDVVGAAARADGPVEAPAARQRAAGRELADGRHAAERLQVTAAAQQRVAGADLAHGDIGVRPECRGCERGRGEQRDGAAHQPA
jgi:hypothetical protein